MRKIKLKNRVVRAWLILGLIAVAFAGQAFADEQNITINIPNGTMKQSDGTTSIPAGNGFVQIIKGSSANPPTGVANSTSGQLSGSDSYAVAVSSPYAGDDIKGPVGYYPGYTAAAGGFYLINMLNHPISTGYYARYWTSDNSYYANSNTEIPWASGSPVPAPMDFTSFTRYQAAPPARPGIAAAVTGYNLSLEPLVTVTITPPTNTQLASIRGGKYHFVVKEGSWTTGRIVIERDTDLVSFTLAPASALSYGSTYYIGVFARNHFLTDDSAANWSDPVASFTIAPLPISGGGPVNVTLRRNFAVGLGINSFSVPRATPTASLPTKTVGGASVPASITTTSITNALDLCTMINEINGGDGPVVRTFGTWDEVNQTEKGVVITYSGSSISNPVSDFPALEAGRGYQVYIKPGTDAADLTLGFTLQ